MNNAALFYLSGSPASRSRRASMSRRVSSSSTRPLVMHSWHRFTPRSTVVSWLCIAGENRPRGRETSHATIYSMFASVPSTSPPGCCLLVPRTPSASTSALSPLAPVKRRTSRPVLPDSIGTDACIGSTYTLSWIASKRARRLTRVRASIALLGPPLGIARRYTHSSRHCTDQRRSRSRRA